MVYRYRPSATPDASDAIKAALPRRITGAEKVAIDRQGDDHGVASPNASAYCQAP